MSRISTWIAFACLLMLAVSSCLTQRNSGPASSSTEAPRLEVHRQNDKKTGKLLEEWTVLVARGSAPVKHGKDLTWFPSGAREWEREFDHGKPKGMWRRYYESGPLMSEQMFAGESIATTRTSWYENGHIRMQGPAKNEERCGTWRIYNKDGTLREEGPFVNSMREGTWTEWSDDGKTSRLVQYKRNVRVGEKPNAVEASANMPGEDGASGTRKD